MSMAIELFNLSNKHCFCCLERSSSNMGSFSFSVSEWRAYASLTEN